VSPAVVGPPLAEFQHVLNDAGFVVGSNVAIEYRWAEGRYDRLPELAADLVQREVAVIVTVGGDPAALAAKTATATIPIVFMIGSDPIKLGLVASFNRPGGNATGINLFISEIEPKRIELLHELLPSAKTFALLVNPKTVDAQAQINDVKKATRTLGLQIEVINVTSDEEIEAGFGQLAQMKIGGIHIAADPFLYVRRNLIVSLAARYVVPVVYPIRGFVEAGGLISYGVSFTDAYRELSHQVVRILQGAKPGELPVVQPTKFELVINLQTARALALSVPPMLLARADEVIE
jgi:putative ABC transport system substrate-binding protein